MELRVSLHSTHVQNGVHPVFAFLVVIFYLFLCMPYATKLVADDLVNHFLVTH